MLFVQAKNCGPARYSAPIKWIVIHTMQAKEKPYTARAVAHWFEGADAPQASAHFCIDSIEVVQCVKENVVAWGAPGANRFGIHLEHAGYSEQTPDEWNDDYSTACLNRSADLAHDLATRYGIPFVHLTPDQLKNGEKGFCGHVDVTNAFSNGKGHTDPGKFFPWEDYLAMCRGFDLVSDPPGLPMPTIALGTQDFTTVLAWQKILIRDGAASFNAADGLFGPRTVLSTKAWQTEHSLAPDGIVGPLTWAKALGATFQDREANTASTLRAPPEADDPPDTPRNGPP